MAVVASAAHLAELVAFSTGSFATSLSPYFSGFIAAECTEGTIWAYGTTMTEEEQDAAYNAAHDEMLKMEDAVRRDRADDIILALAPKSKVYTFRVPTATPVAVLTTVVKDVLDNMAVGDKIFNLSIDAPHAPGRDLKITVAVRDPVTNAKVFLHKLRTRCPEVFSEATLDTDLIQLAAEKGTYANL
jgi:hypothetical protein